MSNTAKGFIQQEAASPARFPISLSSAPSSSGPHRVPQRLARKGLIRLASKAPSPRYHQPPPQDSVATISRPLGSIAKFSSQPHIRRLGGGGSEATPKATRRSNSALPCRPLERCRVAVPSDAVPPEPWPLAVGHGVGSEEAWALSFDHASHCGARQNASCLALQRSRSRAHIRRV